MYDLSNNPSPQMTNSGWFPVVWECFELGSAISINTFEYNFILGSQVI
jgi:hypothetical protein